MTELRPRHTAHRGSVLASGLAIDTGMVPEPQARARILALSARILDVFRIDGVLVARFREPVRVSTRAVEGAPLIRYGRLLSATPLDDDEQQALETVEEMLVLLRGGALVTAPLDAAAREDIAAWIDLSGLIVEENLRALGGVLSEPQAAVAEGAASVRASFGVGPLERDAREALAALMGQQPQTGRRDRRSFLTGLWNVLRRAGAGGRSEAPADTSRSSWLSGIRDVVARALWSSKLARLIGHRHAEYLARLLDMFETNDLDSALRHALPLNAELDGALRPPPLGLPTARTDFSITPARRTSATSLGLGGELFELLRQRYRRAFERLDQQGDIEKAAFVLAELLNAAEEAVSYLERHGRLKLAAEIAEARRLPPGLVIRQWFLAGDRARAIQVARRTGAFADAVVRLERSHPEEGRILRLLWADSLASAGSYAAAVDAAWPVEQARAVALAWIDRAMVVGGPAGARMLARKLRLVPEEFGELRDRGIELLKQESDDDAPTVAAFAQELAADEPTPEIRVLARAAARRLLGAPGSEHNASLARKLIKTAGDPAFEADARPLADRRVVPSSDTSAAPLLRSRPTPLELSRAAPERGTIAVMDAALLPDGRILVALGELGAWLLARDGKVVTRFAEPTHRIVISDHGDRAILLAPRGETFRVSRLDLITRRLQPWCDARFDTFAADFDGSLWFVARRDTLYAVDAIAPRWQHLWKVDERGSAVTAIQRDPGWLSALFARIRAESEVWSFELPSLTLRRRQALERPNASGAAAVAPGGMFVEWQLAPAPSESHAVAGAIVIDPFGRRRTAPITIWWRPDTPTVSNAWIVLPTSNESRTVLHLLDANNLEARAQIEFVGTEGETGARIQGNHLIMWDRAGRVLVLSLQTGAVVSEHRLT